MKKINKTSDEMFIDLNYKIEKTDISHTCTKDDLEMTFILRSDTVFLKKTNQYKMIMLSLDEIKAISKKIEEQEKIKNAGKEIN